MFDQLDMIRFVTHGAIEIVEPDTFREFRSMNNLLTIAHSRGILSPLKPAVIKK